MLQTILQRNMLLYAIAAICILGVISQLVLNSLYERLIRDAESPGGSNGKFLKKVQQRFIAQKRMNEGISDISVFVKKSILEYHSMGMSLHQWRRFGGATMILCLGIAGGGYLLSSMQGYTANIMQNYLWAGAAAALLLIGTQAIVDIGYKSQYLQIGLEDYLHHSGIGQAYQEVNISEPEEIPKKIKEKVPVNIGVKPRQVRPLESKAQKDKRELKQNLAKIKQGMEETATEREQSKERNAEILKQMDPAEQERVIREVLKEFLS